MELYREEDYQAVKRSMLSRFGLLGIVFAVTAVLLALFVTVWRSAVLSVTVCAVGAVLMFFLLHMKVLPWFYYWHYQADIRKGRTHEMDCHFVSLSDSERMSDGVAFREMVVRLDLPEEKNERGEKIDDTRMLFWDADRTAPVLREEEPLHIRAFGNYIVSLDAESLKGGNERK